MNSSPVLVRTNGHRRKERIRAHNQNETKLILTRISFEIDENESARSLHCNRKESAATNNLIYFDIHFVREHFNCTMDDLVFRCIFFCAHSLVRSYHPLHFCLSKCLMVVELLFFPFHVKCVKNTEKNHAVNHNLGFIV